MTGIRQALLSIFALGGSFSSRMEAKDGSFGFDFSGTYTKVIEDSLIEYSFGRVSGILCERHIMMLPRSMYATQEDAGGDAGH